MRSVQFWVIWLYLSGGACVTAFADWRIVPGERVGPINAQTSEADLRRHFGNRNVKRKKIFIEGEHYEWGTVLFERDAERKLEILWHEARRRRPKWVRLTGEKSVWQTVEGIGLGTTLKELERLNGGAFTLLGWGWDYGGLISSWNGGALEKSWLRAKGMISLTVQTGSWPAAQADPSITGDHEARSDQATIQKLNPHVSSIIVEFPTGTSMRN